MNKNSEKVCSTSADPEVAFARLENLYRDQKTASYLEQLEQKQLLSLARVIGLSNFLYHLLCRHPDLILQINKQAEFDCHAEYTAESLRRFKYRELLKITVSDLDQTKAYQDILCDLSLLADHVVKYSLELVKDKPDDELLFSIISMGKLGARELNYSSDIDLIFTFPGLEQSQEEIYSKMVRQIRRFTRQMEDTTDEGFLYRVDLNLRPWGRDGPLLMSVDDTENYYAASTEPMERFIWLRARVIAGVPSFGHDLLSRMRPFVFKSTLSADDLQRFLEIKSDMQKMHRKFGCWNVKQGQGGIRDIEFFIQVLQIVNAHNHAELQSTNTLEVLDGLVKLGYLTQEEGQQIHESYLFLRRLENHLQIIDEQQTQELPDEYKKRLLVARSMVLQADPNDVIMEQFEEQLNFHKAVASNCFEKILPENYTAQ